MVKDTVGDALIRIKNSYLAHREEASLSYSKVVVAICQVLEKEGFIKSTRHEGGDLIVGLKYQGQKPAVTDVKRVSKPGLRIYKSKTNLPWVLNGLGIAIISTPKGVMTDKQARKEGVGGEVMAYIW